LIPTILHLFATAKITIPAIFESNGNRRPAIFVRPQDPMNFFRSWKTPVERYVPLTMQTSGSEQEEKGEEEEG
jgi:hypothetical protein